jgi:NDMA-dependent alcohol dehydrogenase
VRTQAGVLWGPGESWKIEDIELDPPARREVLVKLAASGLCHSEDHMVTGDLEANFPIVGGHEGAGVVVEVGPEVTRTKVGDHVILAAMPACGACRWCSSGRGNLCDLGAFAVTGYGFDGTYRRHQGNTDIGAFCQLGAFSPYVVASEIQAVPIGDDIPLDVAALVGCGVTTGLGSAGAVGDVMPGDVVVVVGVGGIGINAVQGALLRGAAMVIAVDPVERKRQWALEFGAQHVASSIDEARELVSGLTGNVMADKAILSVGVGKGEFVGPMLSLVSKGGRVVITSVPPRGETTMAGSLQDLAVMNKQLVGHVFGQANALADFPRILDLYRNGRLRLDELITRRLSLDELDDGYKAMHSGKVLRAVITFD